MNMSENLPLKDQLETKPCNECQAGVMRLHLITYFTWLGDDLITVPNFPGWICDLCGRREYDEKSVSQLTMLLDPNAGKPTSLKPVSKRRSPKPIARRPAAES